MQYIIPILTVVSHIDPVWYIQFIEVRGMFLFQRGESRFQLSPEFKDLKTILLRRYFTLLCGCFCSVPLSILREMVNDHKEHRKSLC